MPEEKSVTAEWSKLRANWKARHRKPPAPLYHYTTGQGMLGLLQGARLWATNAHFLNDPSEIQYGTKLVQEELEGASRQHKEDLKKVDSGIEGFWDRWIAKIFVASYRVPEIEKWSKEALRVFEAQGEPYITCFCPNGDLLSQWRGYGSAGCGYAVGFDGAKLAHFTLDGAAGSAVLRRVIYNEDDQRKIVHSWVKAIYSGELDLRREIAERFRELRVGKPLAYLLASGKTPEAKQFRDHVADRVAELNRGMEHFTRFLAECLVCFKNPAYHEEAEWRLITFVKIGAATTAQMDFRARQDWVIPYVKLAAAGDPARLPVTHIVCGPILEAAPTAKSVSMLAQKLGYGEVSVKRSTIPYRG